MATVWVWVVNDLHSFRIMYMVKRKARDIVENRLDSKVFANMDVLNSFIGKVENYLQEPIVPFQ